MGLHWSKRVAGVGAAALVLGLSAGCATTDAMTSVEEQLAQTRAVADQAAADAAAASASAADAASRAAAAEARAAAAEEAANAAQATAAEAAEKTERLYKRTLRK